MCVRARALATLTADVGQQRLCYLNKADVGLAARLMSILRPGLARNKRRSQKRQVGG